MILLEHLDVWVVGETCFADGGEIGRFPTRPVQVLLDLRRHRHLCDATLVGDVVSCCLAVWRGA